MTSAPAVRMLDITKRFPGVLANDRVDFSASWGEVHALVGENGAGKSTLMNVLYGIHRQDAGEIRIAGRVERIAAPSDAIRLGIGMVHQHFMLVPAFTVLENIVLGMEPTSFGRVDYASAERKVADIARRFGLDADLRARAGDISVSSQQKVEILKSLYRDARILILDEPTSVLAPRESENLFRMLRSMASEGMCIILISHKLQDVMAYSDRVTVLREGRTVASLETYATSDRELAGLMVGMDTPSVSAGTQPVPSDAPTILEVRELSAGGDSGLPVVDSVSFGLRSGEVLGVAGVDGNGQRELAEALIGLRRARGEVLLDGMDIIGRSARRRMEMGIAYLPEDRRLAMVAEYSIRENSILGRHRAPEFGRLGMLNIAAARSHASSLIEGFDVRATGPGMPMGLLSGGNQQKLVIGRVLGSDPKVIIACQPTRGLDILAASEVHRRLLEARDRGAGILLVSYELDEILSLSDRVLVMYHGRVAGILSRDDADREKIGALMLGAAL